MRECNYGDLTQKSEDSVDYRNFINNPFPNGESLKDVENRVKEFLDDLYKNYAGKHIAIMAHKAPQLALEVILNNRAWEQAIERDWRNTKSWQPGWEYFIK